MNSAYYERFKFFTKSPYWEKYLIWAYNKCLDDLGKIDHRPDFSGNDFTALLCGTSGERTSTIFVEYVLSKNKDAKIILLDISNTQITQSRLALSRTFPGVDIQYFNVDAKNTPLKSGTVNYIETDAFFEFFTLKDLSYLLREWKRLLKPRGYVTTRAFASGNIIEKTLDNIRISIAKKYLGIGIHVHHLTDIEDILHKSGLNFVQGGGAYCPTFKRFSLVKK